MGQYDQIVAGMIGEINGLGSNMALVSGGTHGGDGDDASDLALIAGLLGEEGGGDDDAGVADLVQLAGALGAGGGNASGGISKTALAQIIQQKIAAGSALVQQKGPTKARRWHIGFDSETDVLAGATRKITNDPQIIFKGQRLTVPSDFAGSFLIQDIVVGKTSQLAATGAVPARMYQETAFGNEFDLDTAQISQKITLIVENTSLAPTRFTAGMLGIAIE